MLKDIPFIFCLIFIGCGCSTVMEKEETVPGSSVGPSSISSGSVQKQSFVPTYISTESDQYYDAVEIYDSSPQASQGVYRCQGLVYVIVCIDTNRETIEYLEGTAMLRVVALLREYYPGLPPEFRIRSRVVEKRFDEDTGIYRYAVVYRERDIQRKLTK